jgi:hypothetical protein
VCGVGGGLLLTRSSPRLDFRNRPLLSVVRGAQHLHADLGYSLRVDPQEQLDDVPGDALKGHLPACGHAYVRLRGLRRSASSSGVGAMASVPSSASNITRGRLTTEA